MEIETLAIECGALTRAPIYEEHKRGRNWCATIGRDPLKPGGLSREFWTEAKGEFYYVLPVGLKQGDALEFGADYLTGRANKRYSRRYYVVLEVRPDFVFLARFDSGAEAVKGAPEIVKQYGLVQTV